MTSPAGAWVRNSTVQTFVPAVTSFSAVGGPFVDVPAHHQFAAEVSWVKQRGLLNGWRDGTFRPGLPIERGAMAAVAYRIAGSPGYTAPAHSAYRDMAPGDPFYKEIHWMSAQGITTGMTPTTFAPDMAVNRKDMAAFIYRLEGKPAFTAPTTSPTTTTTRATATVTMTARTTDWTARRTRAAGRRCCMCP